MEALGIVIAVVGIILSVGGSIWFLFEAFSESALWGLGCLFLPLVGLFFLCIHSDRALKPFGVSLLGTLVAIGGAVLANAGNPGNAF